MFVLVLVGRRTAIPCLASGVCCAGMEALQGEVKTLNWTLANIGKVNWPESGTQG